MLHSLKVEYVSSVIYTIMKYSSNLESVMCQVREFQPALADMLEKHVLTEGDSFFSSYNGEWNEYTFGQVCTKKSRCLYLFKDHLTLTADALIVAYIANSVTEYNHCAWCDVKITPMCDGCSDASTLHVEAQWVMHRV